MSHFTEVQKDEILEKMKISDLMREMEIVILTKYHLNALGKKKENREISAIDFNHYLCSLQTFCEASLVIYVDDIYGHRLLKCRYSNDDAIMYMNHLGFEKWTY